MKAECGHCHTPIVVMWSLIGGEPECYDGREMYEGNGPIKLCPRCRRPLRDTVVTDKPPGQRRKEGK